MPYNLIGAATPDGYKHILAHIKPKAKSWFHMAYPAVARAVAVLKKGSKSEFIISNKAKTKEIYDCSTGQVSVYQDAPSEPTIGHYLKAEMEKFLEWVNNPQGLRI